MIDEPSNSRVAAINSLFKEIDDLHSQVLQQIKNILQDHTGTDADPTESSRDRKVKSAAALIQEIPDLLRVVKLRIQHVPSEVAAKHLLSEIFDLHQCKVKHLRRKLKDCQLEAYRAENALIHQQRLKEFGPQNSPTDAKCAEAVDAREALFKDRSTTREAPGESNKAKTLGEQILKQNKSITSSLQQSKQLMTMSVMQTELNIDTLDQQSKDLTQLNDKLIDMEAVLTKSRQIVKFIEKQDKSDKRRIYAAISFLLICSAWVLWRRVLKLPVRILIWTLLESFGVLNWASTVTKRGSSNSEASSAVSLMASSLHSDQEGYTQSHTPEYVEIEPMKSISSSISQTSLSVTYTSSTVRSAEESESSAHKELEGFTGVYTHEIDEERPVLIWDPSIDEHEQYEDTHVTLAEIRPSPKSDMSQEHYVSYLNSDIVTGDEPHIEQDSQPKDFEQMESPSTSHALRSADPDILEGKEKYSLLEPLDNEAIDQRVYVKQNETFSSHTRQDGENRAEHAEQKTTELFMSSSPDIHSKTEHSTSDGDGFIGEEYSQFEANEQHAEHTIEGLYYQSGNEQAFVNTESRPFESEVDADPQLEQDYVSIDTSMSVDIQAEEKSHDENFQQQHDEL